MLCLHRDLKGVSQRKFTVEQTGNYKNTPLHMNIGRNRN